MTGAYWYRNLRQPVQFAPAIGRLLDEGYRTFIEISPHRRPTCCRCLRRSSAGR